jgi:hypothetical protein
MIVWEISIGTIITLVSMLFVASGFFWRTTYDSKEIKSDIKDIKEDIKVLNKLAIESAVLRQEIKNLDNRLDLFEHRFDKVLEFIKIKGMTVG